MAFTQQPGQPVPGYQQPIAGQPGVTPNAPGYMPAPEPIPGIPAGLEYLAQIDQLMIKQVVELFEMFTGFETSNKYKVQNTMGQEVYKAVEKSDFCSKQCCGPNRAFEILLGDNLNRQVISAKREFTCTICPCFSSCRHTLEVTSPLTNETFGFVKQNFFCCTPSFSIYDANMTEIFQMTGPCVTCGCTDRVFEITDLNGTKCGAITKKWTGFLKESYTDADNFNVTFPLDLDVKLKAVIVGATFLVDFMFFEQAANEN